MIYKLEKAVAARNGNVSPGFEDCGYYRAHNMYKTCTQTKPCTEEH